MPVMVRDRPAAIPINPKTIKTIQKKVIYPKASSREEMNMIYASEPLTISVVSHISFLNKNKITDIKPTAKHRTLIAEKTMIPISNADKVIGPISE